MAKPVRDLILACFVLVLVLVFLIASLISKNDIITLAQEDIVQQQKKRTGKKVASVLNKISIYRA